jgi:hypothetical protein
VISSGLRDGSRFSHASKPRQSSVVETSIRQVLEKEGLRRLRQAWRER